MPVNVESQLVSSILRNSDFKTALANGVTAEMFHSHQDEWTWLETYWRKYRRHPTKAAFLAKFPDFRISRVDDTHYYTDEVKRSHVRHTLIGIVNDVTDALSDGDIDSAVKQMNASVISAYAGLNSQNDGDIFASYTDILGDVETRVRRANETGSSGIPSGFSKIDEELGGFNSGESIILGARLGSGKSWLLQAWAAAASAAGKCVLFDALEQSRAQVGMRLHALMSSSVGEQVFASNSLMRGKDFDVRAYRAFLKKLKREIRGRLHVSDTSRGLVSPLTIASQIERIQPDIVFIDYLTLLRKAVADWQGVAENSGAIKSLATRYDIPIVSAAQLNRNDGLGKGNEPPGAEALAQSDAIGQDADIVFTSKQISRHVITMKAAKVRNGPGGWLCWVEFDPTNGVVRDISANRAQTLMDKDADDAADEREGVVKTRLRRPASE